MNPSSCKRCETPDDFSISGLGGLRCGNPWVFLSFLSLSEVSYININIYAYIYVSVYIYICMYVCTTNAYKHVMISTIICRTSKIEYHLK